MCHHDHGQNLIESLISLVISIEILDLVCKALCPGAQSNLMFKFIPPDPLKALVFT